MNHPPSHSSTTAIPVDNIRIESLGVYIPEKILTMEELLDSCRRRPRWDLERITGIHERRVAEGEYSVNLGIKAARQAIKAATTVAAELLGMKGVGPKTIRALALVSELVYGEAPSTRDPARFSFAHGGKDGYPYPVDRATYDASIEFLADALRHAKVDRSEKLEAFRRLHKLSNRSTT